MEFSEHLHLIQIQLELLMMEGLVVAHKNAGGYEIEPKKDSDGNYLFQTPGEPVGIQTQPQSTNGLCREATVEFEILASSQTTISYQWQFFNNS